MTEEVAEGAWWTIDEASLLDMLRRAASGEDPDLILMAEYANSDHEFPGETSDE